jgi:hypothetical protein
MGFGSTRSGMVSNCTSVCCPSRLARGNSSKRTRSETSSNCLCTNDTAPGTEDLSESRIDAMTRHVDRQLGGVATSAQHREGRTITAA